MGALSGAVRHAARPEGPAQAPDHRQTGAGAAAEAGGKERIAAAEASPATADLTGDRARSHQLDRLHRSLDVVINREIDRDGQIDDWVLATTSATLSAAEIRSNYTLRTAIEERHRQYKCFWDLASMPSRKFTLVVNHVLFVLLAYTLMQGHLFLRQRQEMNPRTRGRLLQFLNPTLEVVAVYYQQRFCLLTLAEFATILLELEEEARARLRPKMKQIQRDVYHLLQNARPP